MIGYKLAIITFWIFLMPLGIICATAVIFFHNTLYIAFNFIIILIIAAAIVFCLKAEFLAYTILIVYIGAIAILFLFVIMMLNLNLASVAVLSTWELCIAFILLIKILLVSKVMLVPSVVSCLGKGLLCPNFWYTEDNIKMDSSDDFKFFYTKGDPQEYNCMRLEENLDRLLHILLQESPKVPSLDIENLGRLLYVDFYYLFLMVGSVLLVAMVGALVLTTNKNLKEK